MAERTASLRRLRSGWVGRKLCRKYWRRRGSHVHAGPPNQACQLLGGEPSGLGSAQTYQSDFGLERSCRLAWNHSWSDEVCDQTWSMTTFRSRLWAAFTSASKSASEPNIGSTAQ